MRVDQIALIVEDEHVEVRPCCGGRGVTVDIGRGRVILDLDAAAGGRLRAALGDALKAAKAQAAMPRVNPMQLLGIARGVSA